MEEGGALADTGIPEGHPGSIQPSQEKFQNLVRRKPEEKKGLILG